MFSNPNQTAAVMLVFDGVSSMTGPIHDAAKAGGVAKVKSLQA